MRDHSVGRVENYTGPFLVMFYVLTLMGLIAIWASSDYLVALMVGFGAHAYLSRKLSIKLPGRSDS